MNVLIALPKSMQAKAKAHLHDIWQAETRASATAAFDFFVDAYGVKWYKAVAKLVRDRDVLLSFYDFPVEHSGNTCAHSTRSRAPSPPSGTEPSAPRGV